MYPCCSGKWNNERTEKVVCFKKERSSSFVQDILLSSCADLLALVGGYVCYPRAKGRHLERGRRCHNSFKKCVGLGQKGQDGEKRRKGD